VERDFTAKAPNQLWLTDITEHPTADGKLYLCAIKDVYSARIVGYTNGYTWAVSWMFCGGMRKAPIPCGYWDRGLFCSELPIRIEQMTFSLRVKR
jgi:hypothetical protein